MSETVNRILEGDRADFLREIEGQIEWAEAHDERAVIVRAVLTLAAAYVRAPELYEGTRHAIQADGVARARTRIAQFVRNQTEPIHAIDLADQIERLDLFS